MYMPKDRSNFLAGGELGPRCNGRAPAMLRQGRRERSIRGRGNPTPGRIRPQARRARPTSCAQPKPGVGRDRRRFPNIAPRHGGAHATCVPTVVAETRPTESRVRCAPTLPKRQTTSVETDPSRADSAESRAPSCVFPAKPMSKAPRSPAERVQAPQDRLPQRASRR